MATFRYRLQPLLDQKSREKEEAEEALAERQKELRAERQKLEELRKKEEQLAAQRDGLRRSLLDGGSERPVTGDEIRRRVERLRALGQDVETARDAVFSQKIVIEEAEERLENARRQVAECTRQVEILTKHRSKLERRFLAEAERKEALEQDEIGNILFMRNRQST